MLREAARCGLLLGPEGIASQSALTFGPSSDIPNLSPETINALTRLRTLVKQQYRDARQEFEQEDEVKTLRILLSQEELVKVVEVAAGYDSLSEELSLDDLAGMTESLAGGWLIMEPFILKTRQYTKEGTVEDDKLK